MEEARFIFSSDKLELKTEGDNVFVEGYISTSDQDQVNDIVSKACILDMAEQMKERTIKFDVEHASFRGKSNLEREINKTIVPVAKVDDFVVDKKGLKVRSMLNKFSKRFEEVKGSIKEGFLDAFSIAFVPVKSTIVEKNGEKIRVLDKVNLLNVAYTGNPINTEAKMTEVFAKSLEFLEEKEKDKKKKEKKKKVYKNYEKDGAHAHTENEPLGLHNHPEIEDRLRTEVSFLHERISNILDSEAEEPLYLKDKEIQKKYNHLSENQIKLEEVKKMSEEEKEKDEAKESESEESEKESETSEEVKDEEKPEEPGEEEEKSEEESEEEENTEVKALTKKVDSLSKELAEVKSALKKPHRKSKPVQKDKSENFVEEKAINPLDRI